MQPPFPTDKKRLYVTAIPQRTQVSVRVYHNGYVRAVTAGQSQRFNSGVGVFNWYYYLSLPPQILRVPVVHLEWGSLIQYYTYGTCSVRI